MRRFPSLSGLLILFFISMSGSRSSFPPTLRYDVLVVGGGTGGIAAGIQSARSGAKTAIVEEFSWLGGMLSAAGVSAADGNDNLPSGIWEEFRQAVWKHYGGKQAVSTGWVSNTCFEPHVADSIFKSMAAKELNLQVFYNYRFLHVLKKENKVLGAVFVNDAGKQLRIYAKVTVDATELGDVFKDAGAGYDVGMEAKSYTGESWALDSSNDVLQDITYVATLKDYGKGAERTIPRPASYDSSLFFCSCKSDECPQAVYTCEQMLNYGKLPNHKYMINWPIHGNDFPFDASELNYEQRKKVFQEAKEKTLCFVYYIQHELGYRNLGLADDEYPTADRLPFMPYIREGRRVQGMVRLTVNYLLQPYSQPDKLYRTYVAVGDYPIDSHVDQNPKAPRRSLPRIPSFGIPMGCLIPKSINGLLVAEKGISVSNIVNGASRVQTCVLLTGQAAGLLAAYAANHDIEPRDVKVREIQRRLLDAGCYLLPFVDVRPSDPHFKAIQRIGATGIIKGVGVPYEWKNQTWFYPHRSMSEEELIDGLKDYYPSLADGRLFSKQTVTPESLFKIFSVAGRRVTLKQFKKDWVTFDFKSAYDDHLLLDREMVAVLVDHYLDPFNRPVDILGALKMTPGSQN
ncbi:MAG: FAD-dependent oxidoreductase [Bacteroidota bacterium]